MNTNTNRERLPRAEYLKKKAELAKARKEEHLEFINSKCAPHQRDLVYLLKNNSEIRRFTSLNIINHLCDTGDIPAETQKKSVDFLWDKFRVIADGFGTDYRYTEEFLLKALIKSFEQFAESATKTISTFTNTEGITIK